MSFGASARSLSTAATEDAVMGTPGPRLKKSRVVPRGQPVLNHDWRSGRPWRVTSSWTAQERPHQLLAVTRGRRMTRRWPRRGACGGARCPRRGARPPACRDRARRTARPPRGRRPRPRPSCSACCAGDGRSSARGSRRGADRTPPTLPIPAPAAPVGSRGAGPAGSRPRRARRTELPDDEDTPSLGRPVGGPANPIARRHRGILERGT
jgi:hypothetical protein